MSLPNDPVYFPRYLLSTKRSVLDWADLVSADSIPYHRPYITKIKHCKRERGVWHEFLIIELAYPISDSATRIVPVIVERAIDTGAVPHNMIRPEADFSAETGRINANPEPASRILSRNLSRTSVNSSKTSSTYTSIASSSMPSMGADGLDFIHIPLNGASIHSIDKGSERPYQVCRQLTFNSCMTDYHLAALLIAVNDYAPKYNIASRQCYWYAAVIYDVFRAGLGDNGNSVDYQLRGPLSGPGRFLTFFTIQPKDPPLGDIQPCYQQHLVKFMDRVRANPMNARVEAANARATEEAAARARAVVAANTADTKASEEAAARRRVENENAILRQQLAAQGYAGPSNRAV